MFLENYYDDKRLKMFGFIIFFLVFSFVYILFLKNRIMFISYFYGLFVSFLCFVC